MEQAKLDRINELARLVKLRELTEEETKERQILWDEYLAEWRAGAKATLDNTYIVDQNGMKRKLKSK